jgi:hypothetical protein
MVKIDTAAKHYLALTSVVCIVSVISIIVFIYLYTFGGGIFGNAVVGGFFTGFAGVISVATLPIAGKNAYELAQQFYSVTSIAVDLEQLAFSTKFLGRTRGQTQFVNLNSIDQLILHIDRDKATNRRQASIVIVLDGNTYFKLVDSYRYNLTRKEVCSIAKRLSQALDVPLLDDRTEI